MIIFQKLGEKFSLESMFVLAALETLVLLQDGSCSPNGNTFLFP